MRVLQWKDDRPVRWHLLGKLCRDFSRLNIPNPESTTATQYATAKNVVNITLSLSVTSCTVPRNHHTTMTEHCRTQLQQCTSTVRHWKHATVTNAVHKIFHKVTVIHIPYEGQHGRIHAQHFVYSSTTTMSWLLTVKCGTDAAGAPSTLCAVCSLPCTNLSSNKGSSIVASTVIQHAGGSMADLRGSPQPCQNSSAVLWLQKIYLL